MIRAVIRIYENDIDDNQVISYGDFPAIQKEDGWYHIETKEKLTEVDLNDLLKDE